MILTALEEFLCEGSLPDPFSSHPALAHTSVSPELSPRQEDVSGRAQCQPSMLTAAKHLQFSARSSRKRVNLLEGRERRQELCQSTHSTTSFCTPGSTWSLGFPRKVTVLPLNFCLSWKKVPQNLRSCSSHLCELGTSLSASSCSGIILIHYHCSALEWKMLLLLSL